MPRRLTSEQQLFLIDEMAMFSTPTEAAKAFAERFGFEITRQIAAQYDPTGLSGDHLSKKLRERFHERREQFRAEIDDIPIANRAYRIRQLDGMFRKARDVGNRQQAAAILEQAAKETGGAFTNEHKVALRGKIKTDRHALTPEQTKIALADAIAGALEKGRAA